MPCVMAMLKFLGGKIELNFQLKRTENRCKKAGNAGLYEICKIADIMPASYF